MAIRSLRIIATALLATILPLVGCPAPEITGQSYGSLGTDIAYSVQALADGGAIVAGATSSYGADMKDMYLFRTDASGNELWHRTFGGPGEDFANAVRVLDAGGYVLAGQYTRGPSDGREDMYLVRTDPDGNEVWSMTYGGDEWDLAHDVIALDDGGFLLAGHTSSFGAGGTDAYVVRTDADGNEVWSQTYGTEYNEYIFAARELPDRGFVLAGTTFSDSTADFAALLIRIDSDGTEVWTELYDNDYDDVALDVDVLDDGGFILAGWTNPQGLTGIDAYLVRTDDEGDLVWQARYGGPFDDRFSAVRALSDGNIAAAGRYMWDDRGESDNAYLVVLNGTGAEQRQRTYGGVENDNAQALDVLPDGGFILAGWTDSFTRTRAAYVVRTNANIIAVN
jgi:outer membrane protein assembly factor BamB